MTESPSTIDLPQTVSVRLLLTAEADRQTISEWLATHDRYQQTEAVLDTGTFDICLLDREMLEDEQEVLTQRKQASTEVLPYVLVVPESTADEQISSLQATQPDLWDLVDEVVRSPLIPSELACRLDSVLRLREQSRTLSRQQQQLRMIRDEHTGHGVVITDAAGRIEYVNEAFERQSGYSKSEVLGQNPRLLKSGEHDEAFYQDLWETVTAGEPWHGEVVNRNKQGNTYVLDQTIVPATDSDGTIERFIAVNHEITDLKQLEHRLRQRSEQLEILNRVLRHDIRNDMAVVLGWLDQLAEQIDDEELGSILERIQSSAQHVVELTTVARDISEAMISDKTPELEPVSLTDVLLDVGAKCQDMYDHAEINLPSDPPEVTIKANELLSSVFRNLLNNAVQHNDRKDPVVTVSLEASDGQVCVRIADNGPGVPDRLKEDIFGDEVKGLDSTGTGMGLYLVATLVTLYGGTVWVEDNLAEDDTDDRSGAVFCVEFETVTDEHSPTETS